MRALISPVLSVAVALVGCAPTAPDGGPAVLETEEVGQAFDAESDLSTDEKGPALRERGGGILPGDYPDGLPVYPGATLVDFGSSESGARYVLFQAPDGQATVASRLQAALAAAGWATSAGPEGSVRASRAGRSALLTVRRSGAGASIRVDY